ncbi:MAG: hypothetical protein WCF04_05925, partial [Candidatus Nanopelagicales bacterium]
VFLGVEMRVAPMQCWKFKFFKHQRLGELDLALATIVGEETADALIDAGFQMDDLERLIRALPGSSTIPPPKRSSLSGP